MKYDDPMQTQDDAEARFDLTYKNAITEVVFGIKYEYAIAEGVCCWCRQPVADSPFTEEELEEWRQSGICVNCQNALQERSLQWIKRNRRTTP